MRYRLSPQQKHLWLLQQSNGCDSYRTQGAILIEGEIDAEVFRTAIENVVERLEILRTTFQQLPSIKLPLQVVGEGFAPSIDTFDLSGTDAQRQEAEAGLILRQLSEKPFDLTNGALLHLAMLTLSAKKRLLLIDMPALCADGVGLENLAREISLVYAACAGNEELTVEPIQYADVAEWHNELLEAEDREAGKDYWRRQDLHAISSLRLPFEPPVEDGNFEYSTFDLNIERDLLEKIAAFSEQRNTSTDVFLLTCWYMLLRRLTGQDQMIAGVGLDGRKYEELEEAVGLLIKYLPLQCHLDKTKSFDKLLVEVDETVSEAYTWQEYFDWTLIDKPDLRGAKPSPALFCFDFQEPAAEYTAAGVAFSLRQHHACADSFKIKVSCSHRADRLCAQFHYDSKLYTAEDVERIAGEFFSLMQSALGSPQLPVDELEMMSVAERQRLVHEINSTETVNARVGCVHQLFEEHAARSPDDVAVVFEDRQLTYSELNARANQLAHYLRKSGVAPETTVAICMERSTELLVGLLGILKAGGAYVPLDPALPTERLSYVLEDSRAKLLLTNRSLHETFAGSGVAAVCLDADFEIISQEPAQNPEQQATAENLAYVIYTSGSTGQPKGVAVEHRQLVNYVCAVLERLSLPAGASFATVSTFAADLGNTSVFASLCNGGTLHVISQERASTPALFADYMRRYRVDCLKIVPGHLAALLNASPWRDVLPRRRLILGGEACGWDLIDKLRAEMPDGAIINHYGPTETTVGVLTYQAGEAQPKRISQTVPLGKPLAGARAYVLNEHWQPAATGVAGELYIGGAGVSRGYFQRPSLAAEKFMPDPFSAEPGARLYRTGDRARYLPDGDIEFLGRVDNQIKLRGFRIEPGEIEAVLSQSPHVRENVVVLREDAPGHRRLVAYLVAEPQTSPGIDELRNFAAGKLPDYMVPSAFVQMPALPLTPNGKIDRRALPLPEEVRPEAKKKFVAPRNEIEEMLAEIWSKVLRVKHPGVHDNFFTLGGDSILSIQIIARANQAGLRLTPRQLFQHQTIAELAEVIDTAPATGNEQGVISGAVPLTPIQHWFFERNLVDIHHWNQSLLLECPPDLDVAVMRKVVGQLLLQHDAVRLRFHRDETGWRAFNAAPDEKIPFTHFDLSNVSEEERQATAERIADELQASLNITDGPLMRVAHVRFGASGHDRLLIVMHHLAVDGVSWRVLLEDLHSAYVQIMAGEAARLPPKTTSFKHWAESLESYAQTEELRQELDYWLGELSSAQAALPRDFAGGDNTMASAAHVSVSLDAEETQALLREVPEVYRTQINDVLLAALVQAFSSWTGRRSLLIELEGHGREEIVQGVDLLRTVGWFTTRFPVLLEMGAASNPGDLLKSVKEHLRRIPNNGIGYGLLRYLNRDENAAGKLSGYLPPEVSFNYLGQFHQSTAERQLFNVVNEPRGSMRSPRDERSHLLDVNAITTGGQLQVDWSYSRNLHKEATIRQLAQHFLNALRSLIKHCKTPEARGYTPSDFPLANLNQQQLEKIFNKLGKQAKG
jgi:amino acid adenylation domain-containing protein/non-ribosomal peptide synthase protein (TIGR01720 family)